MEVQLLDHISAPSGSATPALADAIQELKKKKNAVILAHYYQEGGIQDVADYVGDSLGLAQHGASVQADIIVLAGVLFMAETAKILNPEKKVLCPDMNAGCSLADNCPADEFAAFIAQHPGHAVVSYVNCSAEVKALSDILCTSSNAVKVIESLPKDQPIIFAPDQHLGRYLIKKTGRDMLLWNGSCIVHETFHAKTIVQLQARYPQALVIAHPECRESVLELAHHVGSTASLLKFTKESPAQEFIVVTEAGILHQMQRANPGKIFHAAPNSEVCNCAECPFMRLNTMEKIFRCLRDEEPEVDVPEDIRRRALLPLERMLAVS
jgi:quinolinate synthase